jgi:two-component system sensor histidine kinase/response regulator
MRDEDKTREQLISELTDMRQRVIMLERSQGDIDASTYTVAHDLKRPLSLILGFADLLIREYATVSREELLRCLQIIAQSGRKMNGVIDELMLLVHMRDEQDLKIKPLDMGSIVAEAVERLAYIVKRQQAEITVPSRWPDALGYAPWVEEVWFTYISEALRFDAHPLCITLGATEQTGALAPFPTRFWVRVTGRGVTPEQQARMYQTYGSFKPDLVQRIMEKLGGQFGVVGDGEQGIEFYFTLPGGRGPE